MNESFKEKREDDWKKSLTPAQFHILREGGTEPAFSGVYHDMKKSGVYRCAGCGSVLFDSRTKFDSGTGWPSFYDAVEDSIRLHDDRKFFMRRTEVRCSVCNGHLGHVFDDGPDPTGKRYCINSGALDFSEESGVQDNGSIK